MPVPYSSIAAPTVALTTRAMAMTPVTSSHQPYRPGRRTHQSIRRLPRLRGLRPRRASCSARCSSIATASSVDTSPQLDTVTRSGVGSAVTLTVRHLRSHRCRSTQRLRVCAVLVHPQRWVMRQSCEKLSKFSLGQAQSWPAPLGVSCIRPFLHTSGFWRPVYALAAWPVA
jgi:hypothetical protein